VSKDIDPKRARRGWWLVPEFSALALLAVVALPFLGASASAASEVARRAADVIEQASPAEHHQHGHEVTAGERIFCGVYVFGTDPPGVAVANVRTVYGYYFCALGAPGTPYNESSRFDGPVVVTLTGTPSALIAQSGAGYNERVRAMMPDQYESRCFRGLPDSSVAADVRRRYESA
jgi:hypothetical protein